LFIFCTFPMAMPAQCWGLVFSSSSPLLLDGHGQLLSVTIRVHIPKKIITLLNVVQYKTLLFVNHNDTLADEFAVSAPRDTMVVPWDLTEEMLTNTRLLDGNVQTLLSKVSVLLA